MNLNINPAELRRRTDAAIAEGKRKAEEKRLAQLAKDAAKRAADEAKAQSILVQVPTRCEAEVAQGRSHAIVMSIDFGDYDRPLSHNNYNVCEPSWLKGAAAIVYKGCMDAGLRPTLEYWYSGDGIRSGFNIVVHW